MIAEKRETVEECKLNCTDFDLQKELSQVVSLDSVKQYVKSLESKVRNMEEREKAGFRVDRTGIMNMAFLGNSGTGTTMMAKIITKTLFQLHVIATDNYQEAEASELIGEDSEVTAVNIWNIMEQAQGGVLLINNADLLMKSREDENGKAANDNSIRKTYYSFNSIRR